MVSGPVGEDGGDGGGGGGGSVRRGRLSGEERREGRLSEWASG